ncbi:Hypothetical predicted protein [Paramuricea clavata]|uniref:Uncharacterized protein n=1 Tax=Paramuricea clavata TaxID=317549 RepID=A0A7D9J0H2_PARCT|nr:Hypothetical predicted protein [Paramuricea clavata]
MAHSINMLDLIKACEAESELDFLQESSFMLTDEQKEAVLQQRIIFWTNAMAEDIKRENPVGVVNGFMDNWTEDQRRLFNEDWANDDGLCEELEQLPEPPENQKGEGSKRKHASDDVPLKRQRPEEYFNIKSVKQVNVRKFRTTGTDYTVQFNPLDVHGVSNVMSTLNRAFQHLFDRLTSDMAPHDQVRLILNSDQLDKSISLPFLQRDPRTIPDPRSNDPRSNPRTFPGSC